MPCSVDRVNCSLCHPTQDQVGDCGGSGRLRTYADEVAVGLDGVDRCCHCVMLEWETVRVAVFPKLWSLSGNDREISSRLCEQLMNYELLQVDVEDNR